MIRTRVDSLYWFVGVLSVIGFLALLSLASIFSYSPSPPTIVKHYHKGLMESVAAGRGLVRPVGVDGYAAVNDCSHIGGVVQLSIENLPVESFFVVDCSAPQDVETHKQEGLIAEVDWETGVRYGFAWDGIKYFGNGHINAVMGRFYTASEWAKGVTNK